MRLLITIFITALLAWLCSWLFGAWWMIAVIPFLVAIVTRQKPGRAFISGMLAMALLWSILIVITDAANEQILSSRMAQLFGLGHILFLIVNVVLGALVGGLGGWSGASMRKIYKEQQQSR